MEAKLKIKYHVKELEKLRYIDGKSDWIDLRVAENVSMKQGEYRLISMGISVEIPKGYEMLIVPRSSAYKNFGILQTNAMGVVDESFCGDNDIIHMPILAMRDTEIHINDRIGQFRLMPHQPEVHFIEVDHLDNEDRGGFGTTGKA
ncbi:MULTISPECIES: dUTP diphosphatase [Oribacterium]|uniref:dUTP diphosphatase n=1 Tax=Oribacterium sinus TaxID=237576 RepID=A0A7W9W2B9_9FIRM|nr:deoxyuridine 5'-triphosphate nucleotidohydrolase [Oribacterium sinus]MBB6040759.1 dUTP pyrophosphatase [Oribacterium sinus]MBF1304372.1 deoxyuridine 5'-triphosphate nucleotidohydrolase [Oribacterium sinus]